MDTTTNQGNPSDQKPIENAAAVNSLNFVKKCARNEGIAFNDRIWTRVEEVIEANSKWKAAD
jgi:hypothetical protein